MRASTIIIQRKWRAILCGRRAREHFLMIKVGVKKTQHICKELLYKTLRKKNVQDLTIHLSLNALL